MKQQTTKRIEEILKDNERARDNSLLLTARLWLEDVNFDYNMTLAEFMPLLVQGKLTNAWTIRRASQIAQEKNPELRGKEYEKRHLKVVKAKEWVKEMGESFDPQQKII